MVTNSISHDFTSRINSLYYYGSRRFSEVVSLFFGKPKRRSLGERNILGSPSFRHAGETESGLAVLVRVFVQSLLLIGRLQVGRARFEPHLLCLRIQGLAQIGVSLGPGSRQMG